MPIVKVSITIPCRLDRYLRHSYPGVTQGIIEQALRQKQIIVNSLKAVASLRVIAGDEIFIDEKLNFSKKELDTNFSNSVIKLGSKITKDYLIFENEYFLAINKPAGLATQGGSKINLSVDSALKYLNYRGNNLFKLVHRLDKETSGILIIAKNYESSVKLTKAFKERLIAKTYIAIVHGTPAKNFGEIINYIGKKREIEQRNVSIDDKNGKLAISYYKLLKSSVDNSLIEFTPITGRTHQLRFHAKLLDCPIVGDNKYGQKEDNSKYMLLHASSLVLNKKMFGREIVIKAKLPNYFNIKGIYDK